jgi:hypothetical protein
MDALTKTDLKALLGKHETPCVSLYLPTRRAGSEQDRIRWKNLLVAAEQPLLDRGLRSPQVREALEPARQFLKKDEFWMEQSDGLAYFQGPGWARSYRLPAEFAERVFVGERFHVKPLFPLVSENDRFFVLTLSQNQVHLLEGDAQSLRQVDLKGVPKNLAEALRFHDSDEPLVFHTHPAAGLGRGGAIFHGHGVGIDDAKDDLLMYFQRIDRGLHAYLRKERAPLILAGVEYLWPLYREANTYAHLMEEGIAGSPEHISLRELRERAWTLVRPRCEEARKKAAELFAQLSGTGRASVDVGELIAAAHQGRLETLFVALDKEQWGVVDDASGDVTLHAAAEKCDEELLNRAAADAWAHGGTVYVAPSTEMPAPSPLAGVYWLPLAKKGKRP